MRAAIRSRLDQWAVWWWSRWYGTRRLEKVCIGVVGTKGKTTTLALLAAMCERSGMRVAVLSSVTTQIGSVTAGGAVGRGVPSHRYLHRFISRAVAHGCDVVLIECTSYDAVRERHQYVPWKAIIFTNLTPELTALNKHILT